MCNKVKFTKKQAATALNSTKNHRKQYRKEIRYYLCPTCLRFHLTSQEKYEEKIEIPLEELIYRDAWQELMS